MKCPQCGEEINDTKEHVEVKTDNGIQRWHWRCWVKAGGE